MELKKAILKMGVRLAFLPAVCAMTAAAETYVFNEALSGQSNVDWTLASSYSGTYSRNPTADDTVEIPANVTAKVTAGSASWTLINTLARIVPKDGAVFEVDVPGTYEGRAILAVPVTEHGLSGAQNTGTLRKTGEGALELASYGKVKNGINICDYYLNLAVDGGDLYLYKDGTSDSEAFVFVNMTVAEGATLHPCYVGYTRMQNLDGLGAIVQDNPSVVQRTFLDGSGTSSFAGPLVGSKLRIDVTAGRHDFLCATSSCFTICLSGNAICGITKLGLNDKTLSSFGTGNLNFASSSGILYLGEGDETSAKDMWLGANTFIDAGAHGDFTLSGKMDSSGSSTFHVLSLGGSNEMPCVISGTIPGRADERNVYYLRKYGTGTWRMADKTNRGSLGVIDVEDGTLQFDTIAEKGSPCSLGYATNLFVRATGVTYENATRVDYAMVLGSTGTVGTLEYTGTSYVHCTTRPIAVRTNGRFVSSSVRYELDGVYALGAGDHTLALAGGAGVSNMVTHVSDGTDGGVLNVVKEGEGTWEMLGTNTFTGSVFARGGTMRVRNLPTGTKYRWYRICITENIYGSSRYAYNLAENKATDGEKAKVQFSELSLYDQNGVNLLSGFTTYEPDPILGHEFDGDFSDVPVGIAALGTTRSHSFNVVDGHLWRLFDNANTRIQGGVYNSSGGIFLDKPETWLPIIVRLPDDAGEAVRIDFLSSLASTHDYNGRCISAYRLDGSIDGVHWDVGIAQDDALEVPGSAPRWYSDPSATATYGTRVGKGYLISKTSHTKNDSHAFTAVGAANGGVLEVQGDPLTVSGLVIDAAASAGTISNVTFAANGTIDVLNADGAAADVELPGDYSGLENFANLSGWQVKLDGEACRSRTVVIRDGKLFLVPRGIRFIVR